MHAVNLELATLTPCQYGGMTQSNMSVSTEPIQSLYQSTSFCYGGGLPEIYNMHVDHKPGRRGGIYVYLSGSLAIV